MLRGKAGGPQFVIDNAKSPLIKQTIIDSEPLIAAAILGNLQHLQYDDAKSGRPLVFDERVRWYPSPSAVTFFGIPVGNATMFNKRGEKYSDRNDNLFFAYFGATLKVKGQLSGVQTEPDGTKTFCVFAKVDLIDDVTFPYDIFRIQFDPYDAGYELEKTYKYQRFENRLSFYADYSAFKVSPAGKVTYVKQDKPEA